MDPTADSLVAPATDLNGSSSHSLSSANGTGEKQEEEKPKGKNKAGKNKKNQAEYDLEDRWRIWWAGYGASLVLTGVMMPIVSSAILVTLYFAFPDLVTHIPLIISLNPGSEWHILLFAHAITGMVWLIVALCCHPFASASSANPASYGLLKASLCHLRAKLGIDGVDHDLSVIEEKCEDIKNAINEIRKINKPIGVPGDNCNQDNCNQEAKKTALASYIDIRKMLYHSPTGLFWAFGSGYCNAWRLIHQAEQAIIEFDCIEEVIYGALKDKMALEGSTVSSKDELLSALIQAITVLQPTAGIYFNEHQPDKNSGVLAISSKPAIPSQSAAPLKDEATARSVLRSVRRVLNTLQDRSWEGLLRARNRLLSSIVVTGLATHVLLCITVLTIPISNVSNPLTDPLVAATAFYLVGAVTGLFGRFYQESMTGSSVDDFGFSTTRLIATPLLSGLAGVGGVLLLSTLAALGGSLSSANGLDLGQIFHIKAQLLLIAAVFGLTPNLLITGLQNTAKQYESNIQSSRVVTPSTPVKKG
jgi:hypothetical protein